MMGSTSERRTALPESKKYLAERLITRPCSSMYKCTDVQVHHVKEFFSSMERCRVSWTVRSRSCNSACSCCRMVVDPGDSSGNAEDSSTKFCANWASMTG